MRLYVRALPRDAWWRGRMALARSRYGHMHALPSTAAARAWRHGARLLVFTQNRYEQKLDRRTQARQENEFVIATGPYRACSLLFIASIFVGLQGHLAGDIHAGIRD